MCKQVSASQAWLSGSNWKRWFHFLVTRGVMPRRGTGKCTVATGQAFGRVASVIQSVLFFTVYPRQTSDECSFRLFSQFRLAWTRARQSHLIDVNKFMWAVVVAARHLRKGAHQCWFSSRNRTQEIEFWKVTLVTLLKCEICWCRCLFESCTISIVVCFVSTGINIFWILIPSYNACFIWNISEVLIV